MRCARLWGPRVGTASAPCNEAWGTEQRASGGRTTGGQHRRGETEEYTNQNPSPTSAGARDTEGGPNVGQRIESHEAKEYILESEKRTIGMCMDTDD